MEPINLDNDLNKDREIIHREGGHRTLWLIQLRWLVGLMIVAGSLVSWLLKVKFAAGPVILTALYIFTYNVFFFLRTRRRQKKGGWDTAAIKRFTYEQVSLDYSAMFLLIHFTGGAASPLIIFFILHVIFASLLLPPRAAFGFAGLAACGMAMIASAEYYHLLSPHPISWGGRAIDLAEQPFHMMVKLTFFTASLFLTAFATTTLISPFHTRLHNLVDLFEAVVRINKRLNVLYQITQSITATTHFEQILKIVTSDLTNILNIQGTAIKLLSEDGQTLSYVSVHGLPPAFIRQQTIEVAKSPLDCRIIQGEPFVIVNVPESDPFQFSEYLPAAGIKSVMSTALTGEKRVIGILSAYSKEPNYFGVEELDFFRMAAGLTAVALENARIFDSIEKLMKERSWFMRRVAHHLQSPLSAIKSTLNLMLGEYLGAFTDNQIKYLQRIDSRSQAMLRMVAELMALAETRNRERLASHRPVDLAMFARAVADGYRAKAETKGLTFHLNIAPNLPPVMGDAEMLEQMIENLVSNAIKYTPPGGRVEMELTMETHDALRLQVSDTGIGIPEEAMPRLFTEFFRAENAKLVEETGTGLGLSIVKDTIRQHHGTIAVESKEGQGTTFIITLPIRGKDVGKN